MLRRVVEPLERTVQEPADDAAPAGRSDEFLDEQRVSAGAGVQVVSVDLAVGRTGRLRCDELPYSVDIESGKRDQPRGATQVVQAGRVGLVIAAASHERDRCVVHSARQVLEHPDGSGVGPVQILEQNQRRGAGGECIGQQFEVVPTTRLGREGRVAYRLDPEGAVHSAPQLHRIAPGPVGLTPQHPHPRGSGDRRGFVEQTGLAYAGFADH